VAVLPAGHPGNVNSEAITEIDSCFINRDALNLRPEFELTSGRFALEAAEAIRVEIDGKRS
jgi:hypothetical protein